jgi:hypothetical protein
MPVPTKLTKRLFTFNEVVIIVLLTFILADSPIWYLAGDWSDGDEAKKTGAGAGQVIGGAILAIVGKVVKDWLSEDKDKEEP